MIARPARLEDWTLPLVREIAESGINENDWYDVKEDLQGKAEHQRKVVAAFANTQGGFLIFGVSNEREIVGVSNAELPRDFGNKLTHGLNPSAAFRFLAPLPVSVNAAVWICEVPRSRRGPHAVLISDHWVFPRRTESGSNVSMNVEEIRMAFQDTETRRIKLAHLSSELHHIHAIAQHLLVAVPRDAPYQGVLTIREAWATRYPTTVVDLLLGDAFGFLGEQGELWRLLQDLRTEARSSNAMAEAYSDYQFIRTSGEPAQRRLLYEKMREHAQRISASAESAKLLVDSALKGTG